MARWYRPFLLSSLCSLCLCGSNLFADPPVASYIFPAGGQRGQTVKVRVGGLYLHKACSWEVLGAGVSASKQLQRMPTRWFEGPLLPLPASQQAEDYPQDMEGEIRILADAVLGARRARLWTSEGAASGLAFVVGELPEVLEREVAGDPVPVDVKLPVTINGRIFPCEDVDVWAIDLRKGQTVTCEVRAARLGSPLDSRLEVRGPDGRALAENDDHFGADSLLSFTAPVDGKYQVRIHDTNRKGGQNYVYRLTLTAGPFVESVYPLGGRRGSRAAFALSGPSTPRAPVEVTLPGGEAGPLVRFPIGGHLSNAVRLDLDDLPEHQGPARLVALPALVNGRIDRPGAVDTWKFSARRGEVVALQLRARQLGSPLQGVLQVSDAAGKTLAQAEASGAQLDPVLLFTAPADATYGVSVRERFRSRGGPAFAYRLRLAAPVHDFRLFLAADALSLPRGKPARLRVTALRHDGWNGPIALAVEGLPAGVKVGKANFNPGQTAIDLTFTAEASTVIGVSRLRVKGTATIAGRAIERTAACTGPLEAPPSADLLLGVGLPAPFKVVGTYDLRLAARGTRFRKPFKIVRNGYTGTLEVRLADRQARHLQGVTGPVLIIPPGVDAFEYPVELPPWMETGRTSRACITISGIVREAGVEHTVSYTSAAQNDQIIAVVETGRLGLEADLTSLAARPGTTVTVPVRLRRGKGLVGPIRVELVVPEHVRGLSAEPIVLTADRSTGTLTLRFGPSGLGPFNAPLVVRATLTEATGPVVAMTKLEVVAEE